METVQSISNASWTSSVTDNSDQVASINLIIKKLGHDLEEIRLRSLDSLISKLNNQVLTEHDLCQHKQLFVKLFELFNYQEFNQHQKVLDLILLFAKNKSAVRNIQDINGLQFLTNLKNNLKEKEHVSKLEQIIDVLLETNQNESSNQSNLIQSVLFSSNTFNSNDLDQLKQPDYHDSSSSSIRATVNAAFANVAAVSTSDIISNSTCTLTEQNNFINVKFGIKNLKKKFI